MQSMAIIKNMSDVQNPVPVASLEGEKTHFFDGCAVENGDLPHLV